MGNYKATIIDYNVPAVTWYNLKSILKPPLMVKKSRYL